MAAVVLLFVGTVWLSGFVIRGSYLFENCTLTERLENFRAFQADGALTGETALWSEGKMRCFTATFLRSGEDKWEKPDVADRLYGWLLPDDVYDEYRQAFTAALADGERFPVLLSPPEVTVSYEDSWGGERTYGGRRRHEGTDLMSSGSTTSRGVIAVVSASDGVIEKKGWLKLGGYRLGIRGPHGAYYYYAHLDHYADGIYEGADVSAGQIIGYMGDTGYGDEGTQGKFAVHLHFGIYIKVKQEEISINPFWILKKLEES